MQVDSAVKNEAKRWSQIPLGDSSKQCPACGEFQIVLGDLRQLDTTTAHMCKAPTRKATKKRGHNAISDTHTPKLGERKRKMAQNESMYFPPTS